MKVIGLTGGLGMGKSTAATFLQQRGLPVVDTDALAREVVEPGQPALGEIQRAFGAGIIGADGRLRRDELARLVFADEAKRRQLEAITHPCIRERWQAAVAGWRAQGHALGVVVIPLLFETQAEACFDVIICVACSAPTQAERLRGRGWSAEEIRQRNQAQWPIEKKLAASRFVVWTEGTLAAHAGQLDRILATLRAG
jgi:dephospho-CoA kinase